MKYFAEPLVTFCGILGFQGTPVEKRALEVQMMAWGETFSALGFLVQN